MVVFTVQWNEPVICIHISCFCSVTKSCPTLWDSVDSSPLVSSVCEIFQARILEWVAISSSRGSSQPRNQTHVSCMACIGRRILYPWTNHLGSLLYTPPFWTSPSSHHSPSSRVPVLCSMFSLAVYFMHSINSISGNPQESHSKICAIFPLTMWCVH